MSALARFPSGGPWEARYGYCRAVRAGDSLHVSGTAAVDEDGVVPGVGDAYAQAVFVLDRIEAALERAGARIDQVVRTRVYVVGPERADDVGRAHAERFGEHPPASAMIPVRSLLDPRMLVEIEADAYLGDG